MKPPHPSIRIPLSLQRPQSLDPPLLMPIHLLHLLIAIGIIHIGSEVTTAFVARVDEGAELVPVERGDVVEEGRAGRGMGVGGLEGAGWGRGC